MSPAVTVVIMVAFVVAIIAVDVVLARAGGGTYSEVLRDAGERWMPLIMLVCFGMGLLAGHWWW